jgi:integrase/recombinase XerD
LRGSAPMLLAAIFPQLWLRPREPYDEGMDDHTPHNSATEAPKHHEIASTLPLISFMLPAFLDHLRVEENRSPGTLHRYHSHIQRFLTEAGDCSVGEISSEQLSFFKRRLLDARLSPATMAAMLSCLRTFLKYLREVHQLPVYDPARIRRPKIPKHEVAYLTKDEVQRFLQSIPTHTFTGLRDRALIEILYASGMRISEALSLDRQQIDWEKQEARIIGKGKKPRKVYFTQGALRWLQDYLAYRHDDHPALFIIQSDQPKRLEAHGTWRRFRRYATRAGLSKRVYPHMLRHTMATTLLANGCPIGHIKALLGHEHLTTTCKYYLGIISDAEAKAAHGKYISYKTETSQETDGPLQGSENIGAE